LVIATELRTSAALVVHVFVGWTFRHHILDALLAYVASKRQHRDAAPDITKLAFEERPIRRRSVAKARLAAPILIERRRCFGRVAALISVPHDLADDLDNLSALLHEVGKALVLGRRQFIEMIHVRFVLKAAADAAYSVLLVDTSSAIRCRSISMVFSASSMARARISGLNVLATAANCFAA
jgi:hypothetical protein